VRRGRRRNVHDGRSGAAERDANDAKAMQVKFLALLSCSSRKYPCPAQIPFRYDRLCFVDARRSVTLVRRVALRRVAPASRCTGASRINDARDYKIT